MNHANQALSVPRLDIDAGRLGTAARLSAITLLALILLPLSIKRRRS